MADDVTEPEAPETGEPEGSQGVEDTPSQPPESPPEETTSQETEEEVLIGGRFRPDQVTEIDETIRYADRQRQENSELRARLEQVERNQAPKQELRERTPEAEIADVRAMFEAGEIAEVDYLDHLSDIKDRERHKVDAHARQAYAIQERANTVLQSEYPDYATAGTSQNEETVRFMGQWSQDYGEDLSKNPRGAAIVKKHLDSVFGARKAEVRGRQNESQRRQRVSRHLDGVDRVGGSKEPEVPDLVLKGGVDRDMMKTLGYNPDSQEDLRRFAGAAAPATMERMFKNPEAMVDR
jgi:hypothetical protein